MTVKQHIDIERLVTWALRDQGLGWTGGGAAGDSLAGLAELGTRVDVSASSGLPPPGMGLCSSDDALDVRRAIDLLPRAAAALVILHGRIATRPEWGEDGYGLPPQLVNKRGQPTWLYRDPKNRRGKIGPALDWKAYDHHVAQVDFERAQWTVWREGLVALRDALIASQKEHVPTGPDAPREPWCAIADEGPVEIPFGQSMAARRAAAQALIRPENVDWQFGDAQSPDDQRRKTTQNKGLETSQNKAGTSPR